MELAAVLLTRAAAYEQATTLYGRLELQPPQWGALGLRTRAASLAALPILDHATELRSTGAAMALHEMAAYTLAALDTIT